MIRDKLLVEHAQLFDWPAIVSLRARYFAQFDRVVQERPEATWVVCRRGDVVIGCYSYQHVAELEQTWVLDFYRTAGRDGARAVRAMYADIVTNLASAYDVLFTLDPRNAMFERVVVGVEAEDVGHIYRIPKGHR